MANRVSGVVPNLVNGVSQQAPALRLPSQGENQENYYSTIIDGLKDRPPSESIAKLKSSLAAGAFVHIINRDVDERYVAISDGTSIEVYDFDGNAKTVTAPNGYGYFTSATSPKDDLTALTIHDYTFLVNKNETPAAGSTVATVRDHEAMVNVIQGDYERVFIIKIGGVIKAKYKTTGSANPDYIDTSLIAQILIDGKDLEGAAAGHGTITSSLDSSSINAAGGWTVARYGNAIHISKDDGTDFDISVQDGSGGNSLKAVKGRTQHFSDLPTKGPDGFVCEIIGDDSTSFDNYWVKIDATAAGTDNQVVWKETVKPGLTLDIDPDTMPHTLVRNADGTFTFDRATWDQRKCGDDDISPMPSFVGTPIENVYLHHDRLMFLSGENLILSRTGSFFDFFRTSATALLDDDPIDIGAAHSKVALLKSAVPYQKQMVVFSDQTQFVLAGNNDQLTPKTASLLPITEYVSDIGVHPVSVGTSIFFGAVRGDWEAVWEYVINYTANGPLGDANETTDATPSYIPSGLFKLIGTSNENVVVGLTTGDTDGLYVYRFYYQDNKKVQSSWSRFTLPGATILNGAFINSELYLVVSRSDGVYLEKLQMQPSAKDTELEFVVHLDRRVHTDDLAAPTYDSGMDTTTYTLPYNPSADTVAVTSPGNVDVLPALQLTVASYTGATITLTGDTTDYPIWFGNTYERRYTFSEFFLRQSNGQGGSITVESGRLQVQYLTLAYNNTSYFTVEVTPLGRDTRTYAYTGRTLGAPDNLLGVVPVRSGSKVIPIMSKSNRVTIEIVNDSWMPSAFVNAIWTGTHNPKAKDF